MIRGSHNANFHGFLLARFPGCEAAVGGVCVMAFHGVADVVGEYGYAGHF